MDLVFDHSAASRKPVARGGLREHIGSNETEAVARILAAAEIPAAARDRIAETARRLVAAVRRERLGKGGIDAFLARIRAVLARRAWR